MIGLVMAAAVATLPSQQVDVDALSAKLAACHARTESAAISCMKRSFSVKLTDQIFNMRQPEFWGEFDPLKKALSIGFFRTGGDFDTRGRGPLWDHYESEGLEKIHLFEYTYTAYVLESYWLKTHECKYNEEDRLKIAKQDKDFADSVARDQAEVRRIEATEGVRLEVDYLPFHDKLNVSCKLWSEKAQ